MLEQTCASLPYGDSETCVPLPTENLFTGKERDAETSASNNSVGSAGRSRAAFKANSRSHSATVFPAPSAAVSTSASSSGVTLVAMVLARRSGRASPFGESGDCNGFGMYGFNKDGIFLEMPYIYDATGAPTDRSSSVRWSDGDRVAKGAISTQIPNTRSCDPSAKGFTTQSDYVRDQAGQQLREFTTGSNGSIPSADRFLADRLTS
jgi:hypothetical protein